MDFCFHIANPNQKQLHALQCGKNTRSCVNLNPLDATHKEWRSDIDGSLSLESEAGISWLAT